MLTLKIAALSSYVMFQPNVVFWLFWFHILCANVVTNEIILCIQSDSLDVNGHASQTTDSDSEALITPETKKDDDGSFLMSVYC